MLRDRKALLEQEIKRAHTEAANMYLSLAVSGGNVHGKEYQDLKAKISGLKSDLGEVNKLMHQGLE